MAGGAAWWLGGLERPAVTVGAGAAQGVSASSASLLAPAESGRVTAASEMSASPRAREPLPVVAPSAAASAARLPTRAVKAVSPAGPMELQLLQAAAAALKGDPARALALTERHRRLFPQGALAQEREVLAIEALARLDGNAAQARARAFKQAYPGSAQQSKVSAAVRGH